MQILEDFQVLRFYFDSSRTHRAALFQGTRTSIVRIESITSRFRDPTSTMNLQTQHQAGVVELKQQKSKSDEDDMDGGVSLTFEDMIKGRGEADYVLRGNGGFKSSPSAVAA